MVAGDHHGDLQRAELGQFAVSAHQETRVRIELLDLVFRKREQCGRQRFQLRDELLPGLLQLLLIRHSSLPAGGDDLGLKTLRQHHADVVAQHVPRLLLDQQRSLEAHRPRSHTWP